MAKKIGTALFILLIVMAAGMFWTVVLFGQQVAQPQAAPGPQNVTAAQQMQHLQAQMQALQTQQRVVQIQQQIAALQAELQGLGVPVQGVQPPPLVCVPAPPGKKKGGFLAGVLKREQDRAEAIAQGQLNKAGQTITRDTHGNVDGGVLPTVGDIKGGVTQAMPQACPAGFVPVKAAQKAQLP